MVSPESDKDEPLTPAGRLFLRPEMNQIINCAIGGKHPIDAAAMKSEVATSILAHHPRFSSLLVHDRHGLEHWRKTHVDVDRHVIIVDSPAGEDAVNDYLADLAVSSPLSTNKPLWEIHILKSQNCAVFRFHHALGDGISLVSLLLSCCRKVDDPDSLPTIVASSSSSTNGGNSDRRRTAVPLRLVKEVWRLVKMVWLTLVFVGALVGRVLWVRDKKMVVSGGEGVELWPRKVATARFRLDHMKMVKRAIPNATINDVLLGVISSGLSRYLDLRSPNTLQEGLQITGVAMVNLRQQQGFQYISSLVRGNSKAQWGNKFGMILLPVYLLTSGDDPLQYLRRAKRMTDRKKLSLEALLSYKIGDLVMSLLGAKVASLLSYRIVCNTSFTISNVLGPLEEVTLAGNPVAYLRVTSSSLPHAITMHMMSYAGRADMQIMVAKDIIPDPKVLAKCFEDALLEMKEAAAANTKSI